MNKTLIRCRSMAIMVMIAAFAGLGACATMSGDECLTSDWSSIGFEDGARGYTADRIGEHRKACAKHGVTPSLVDYQNGREQGLVEYCQPSRGFRIGSNGGSYNGVCNAHYEADFLDAYNAGSHLYVLRSNVNHAESAIHSTERELEQLDEDIHAVELLLISSDTTTEERISLLLDLKELSARSGRLDAEIRDLHEQRAYSRVELEHYRNRIADLGY